MEIFENGKSVLKFDLTPKQIKFKNILDKEFLELEVYAISDANPNRNGSHFTLDAMKKVVENGDLKNKPIIGFFDKGDFASHEGSVGYDVELQKEYWDTSRGERILGWIRESDPVEIVEKDGLHWIKFNCVLCIHYCYAQVKRLVKDRRKRVSVEITINEGKKNGDILDILDFTLNGTTILGSKNGKTVMEGIAGAHASILDGIDEYAMQEQKKILSFAYEQIDSPANKDINLSCTDNSGNEQNFAGKEDEAVMENEQNKTVVENENEGNFAANENTDPVTEEGKNDGDLQMDGDCGGENCGGANGECGSAGEPGEPGCNNAENDNDDAENNCKMNDGEETELCKMQAKVAELEAKCAEYCETIAKMGEEAEAMKNSLCKMQEYEAKEEQYAARADYDDVKARMEAAEAKVHEYFCADLKATAESLMSGEKINKEDYEAIVGKCNNGEYSDKEDIKRDVAFAVYNARPVENKQFSAPFSVPETGRNVDAKQQRLTREQRIAARCKK